MKVTYNSSPGFGGSTCPCLLAGVKEKERAAAGRVAVRGAARGIIENAVTFNDWDSGVKEEAVREAGARENARDRKRALGVAMVICVSQEKEKKAGRSRRGR